MLTIIPSVVFPAFFLFSSLVFLLICLCNKRKKQRQGHPVHYVNNSNAGTQVVLNSDWRAPAPSYFQGEPQRFHTQVTTDQPPPYSAHVKLYHTRASGQPMMSRNLMQGLDNTAFLNRNINNSDSSFPNMMDDPPTGSRTSIPAVVVAEQSNKNINK